MHITATVSIRFPCIVKLENYVKYTEKKRINYIFRGKEMLYKYSEDHRPHIKQKPYLNENIFFTMNYSYTYT